MSNETVVQAQTKLGEEGSEVVTHCYGLKLPAANGKQRVRDCGASNEGMNKSATGSSRNYREILGSSVGASRKLQEARAGW